MMIQICGAICLVTILYLRMVIKHLQSRVEAYELMLNLYQQYFEKTKDITTKVFEVEE